MHYKNVKPLSFLGLAGLLFLALTVLAPLLLLHDFRAAGGRLGGHAAGISAALAGFAAVRLLIAGGGHWWCKLKLGFLGRRFHLEEARFESRLWNFLVDSRQ